MLRSLHEPAEIAAWLRQRVRGDLCCDSRRLRAGDGFVAWPGAATDGRRFVPVALAAGAAAVLVERDGAEAYGFADERIVAVPGLKALSGPIAAAFYGAPSTALDIVAFTGTNGKTSSAWWAAQLLGAVGRPCGLVGTLGIGRPPIAGDGGDLSDTGLTTPDPVLLQRRLRGMVDAGLVACAMEASSIGLVERRLDATRIRVAVLTNFTQDHLDFHGSMAAYWQAKAALFDWPGLAAAVLNVDDTQGAALAATLAGRDGMDVWTVAVEAEARLSAHELAFTRDGLRMSLVERDVQGRECGRHALALPIVGRYNVSNLLGVLAAARALGVPLVEAVAALPQLTPVPGRLQRVGEAADGPLVLVDYAHTPDALEKVLQALRPLANARGGALAVVVGCGGDRDPLKRPLMAAVAEREADRVVLTSDNPRSEDPLAILAQMRAGLRAPQQVLIEPDRARAIAHAVVTAGDADVVLLAGKGHEDYQEIRGERRHFSDAEEAARALCARRAACAGAVGP
jgi:UDP-N-acetylmuramyl-tripeptide synthetase